MDSRIEIKAYKDIGVESHAASIGCPDDAISEARSDEPTRQVLGALGLDHRPLRSWIDVIKFANIYTWGGMN